jgi:hypothetical protein
MQRIIMAVIVLAAVGYRLGIRSGQGSCRPSRQEPRRLAVIRTRHPDARPRQRPLLR